MSTFTPSLDIFHYSAHRKWSMFFSSIVIVIVFVSINSHVHHIFTTTAILYFTHSLCLGLSNVLKKLLIRSRKVNPIDKCVLVTGSASGFGRELVKKLDKFGFHVFAACRNVNDDRATSLIESCSSRVELIKLDVTNEDDIQRSVTTITEKLRGRKLWAIVCNAGVYTQIPFDWGESKIGVNTITEYENTMNTNAFGTVRLVKSFTPLLKRTKSSRIVLTSSIASFIPGPILAPYSMSKHALSAFGTSIRLELRPFDVYVSQIQPVYYSTNLVEKSKIRKRLESSWSETSDHIKATYSPKQKERIINFALHMLDMSRDDPSEVVDALMDTVTTTREPDHFVMISGWFDIFVYYLVYLLPSEMLDYGYFYPIGHFVIDVIIFGNKVFDTIGRIFRRLVCGTKTSKRD